MRALPLVLVLACGCTQAQVRKLHRGGEVATASGLVGILACGTAASLLPAHEDTLMGIGLGFVPISLIGALLYVATDGRATQDTPPAPTRRERQRATAWDLTKQAATAAREQDCTQVLAIAPRVRDLDQELHLSVFMRDTAIQRCLRTAR